jgi:hypothetical protein
MIGDVLWIIAIAALLVSPLVLADLLKMVR